MARRANIIFQKALKCMPANVANLFNNIPASYSAAFAAALVAYANPDGSKIIKSDMALTLFECSHKLSVSHSQKAITAVLSKIFSDDNRLKKAKLEAFGALSEAEKLYPTQANMPTIRQSKR